MVVDTKAVDVEVTSHERVVSSSTPWILGSFALVLFALPTVVVLPGPLVSNGSPAKMFAYVLGGLVILTFINSKKTRGPRKLNAGVLIMVIYAVCQAFVLFRTWSHALSSDEQSTVTRELLTIFATCGLTIYTMTRISSSKARDFVLALLIVGATYAAVVGLLQGISGIDLKYLLQPPGFVLKAEKSLAVRDGFTRVIGTSDHPIEFSVMVAAVLPLTAHYLRYSESRNVKFFSGLSLVVLLLAVPASVSRTAIVALLASVAVYIFALSVREIFSTAIALGIIVLFYYVAAPDLFQAVIRLFTDASQDTSITSRTDDYAYVGDLLRLHPFLGSGFGSTIPGETRYLDNQWLGTLIEGGLVGAGALALVIIGGVAGLTLALRTVTTKRERDLVFALSGSFAALAVSTTVFDTFSFQQATFLLFLVVGMLWSLANPTGNTVGDWDRSSRRQMFASQPEGS